MQNRVSSNNSRTTLYSHRKDSSTSLWTNPKASLLFFSNLLRKTLWTMRAKRFRPSYKVNLSFWRICIKWTWAAKSTVMTIMGPTAPCCFFWNPRYLTSWVNSSTFVKGTSNSYILLRRNTTWSKSCCHTFWFSTEFRLKSPSWISPARPKVSCQVGRCCGRNGKFSGAPPQYWCSGSTTAGSLSSNS
jgi:hypothetical protein